MRISDVISDLCSSDLHETGLLRLGALCLDISIHNLERIERATKLRRKIGCSALDQLDAMLTHHRTAPQALRIGRDKRHVIDAAAKIGRAHVCTPVTNAHIVCRLLLEKKKI